jgi:hypothetical protein
LLQGVTLFRDNLSSAARNRSFSALPSTLA